MERFEVLPRDLEPITLGQLALRQWIDDLIADADRRAFEIMMQLKDMQ